MTELEIKRVCQILVRLALQVQELKENGKIPTRQTQEATRSDQSDVETGRTTNTGPSRDIRQTIHKGSGSKERPIGRDAD